MVSFKRASTLQQALLAKIKTSEEKLAVLEGSLTSEQQRLSTLITDYQTQFSTAQDQRATKFSESQNDQLTKLTTAFTEFQTQFSTAQNARETTFSEFQRTSVDKVASIVSSAESQLVKHDEEYVAKLGTASKNYEERLGELQREYAEEAAKVLALVQKKKKEVEDLVGVIGNLGVTHGYQTAANNAKWTMRFWQLVTSISLIGLILVAMLTAFPSLLPGDNHAIAVVGSVQASKTTSGAAVNKGSDGVKAESKTEYKVSVSPSEVPTENAFYHGLATRIFLALTFGIFAGYAGRQASYFMRIERNNRKLALELEALGPFIEPLDSTERNKFRIQVGERSFGVPDNEERHRGDDPVTLLDLLRSKDLRDALLDLYNKGKRPV